MNQIAAANNYYFFFTFSKKPPTAHNISYLQQAIHLKGKLHNSMLEYKKTGNKQDK